MAAQMGMVRVGKRVVGLGAGGHARVVIEILRCSSSSYEVAGLLDPDTALHGTRVLGVPVLGDDSMLPDLARKGISRFFVGVGSVGDRKPRQRLFEKAVLLGMEPVQAVHPRAVVSPSAETGAGTTVMAGAVINACARVGTNVIVNTGAVVEHDCIVGDHVHIATGAVVAGGVCVGNGAHIGAGATVLQGLRIGGNAIVGAGAVVVADVEPDVTVVGCPARQLGYEVGVRKQEKDRDMRGKQ